MLSKTFTSGRIPRADYWEDRIAEEYPKGVIGFTHSTVLARRL